MSEAMEGVTADAGGGPGHTRARGGATGGRIRRGGGGGGETYELDIVGVPRHGGAYVLYDISGTALRCPPNMCPLSGPLGEGPMGLSGK